MVAETVSKITMSTIPGFHDEGMVKKIPYTKLGSTDLIVSKLSLGCGPIAHGTCINWKTNTVESGHEEAEATIISALKSGINYLDTAPIYGSGRSEMVLGHVLKNVPRSSYVLATKVGRTPQWTFDYTAQGVINSVQSSLNKLGVDYIDIIQVHDVEFAPSVDMIVNETLPALDSLRSAGKVGHIGVTGYPLGPLKEVLERSKVKIDLVLSYCRQTLFDQEMQSYLPFFRSDKLGTRGLGVINAAVHGMGLLIGGRNKLKEWHPAQEQIRLFCAEANRRCNEAGVDIARLALYEAIHGNDTKSVDTTLVGMNTRSVLDSNLDVLINGISDKEKQMLKEVKKYFSTLSERNWEGFELEKYKKNPELFCENLYNLHLS